MKLPITLIAVIAFIGTCAAQDFTKAMATAKTSYSAGKLEDAHFALQQAMQEVDLTIGKEVLKLLPTKMDVMETIPNEDNVASNIGYVALLLTAAIKKMAGKPIFLY